MEYSQRDVSYAERTGQIARSKSTVPSHCEVRTDPILRARAHSFTSRPAPRNSRALQPFLRPSQAPASTILPAYHHQSTQSRMPPKGAIRGTAIGRPAPAKGGVARQVYEGITNPENRSLVTAITFFAVRADSGYHMSRRTGGADGFS
jgi:hypothetical protein